MNRMSEYEQFLKAKVAVAKTDGIEIHAKTIHPILKPHQRAIVEWAVKGGRRGIFAAFWLGETMIQLETLRIILEAKGGPGLIVLPLGVRQEFTRDAALLGIDVKFVRRTDEVAPWGIHLTNYESVRDGKLDPSMFTAASLDEASALRGFGGTKTFREFMRLFETVKYKYVATATPSPNEYIEILCYSAFLGIMDVGEAKTRFFKRDSTQADKLTIHPHKEREFWLWVASWGLFVQKPSDLGPEYSDAGYDLPEMVVNWHEVETDHLTAGTDRNGQGKLFRSSAIGVQDAAKEKRDSLPARIAKMMELRAEDPGAHRLLWHDLEAERNAIEDAVPGAVTVYGTQDLDERERRVIAFSDGEVQELASKPVLLGSGCNFQRFCAWAIFLGIGFKFNDFIQAIHRIHRFLQPSRVRIDLIYTEAEREIRRALEAKWERHKAQAEIMAKIIREYGLAQDALTKALSRTIGVERAESSGKRWRAVNNDCVAETIEMKSSSVHLILTSIPFATQYEYTPSYNDFGHTDDNDHFWQQMDFLTPELLRVLQPGRVCVIHVKDRIIPGGMTGLGFQTVAPFHCEAIAHFTRHGFAYLGMKTIVTDVVRENNQTYRLGWTEQCKDGSRMGVGMPEYLLIFRRSPTDRSNGYADVPVVKEKPLCDDDGTPAPFDSRKNWKRPVPGTGYSRGRWQIDAHGFARSGGDRLISGDELRSLPHEALYKLWRDRSLEKPYDYEEHVEITEELDHLERLPATFMLFPPHSRHPDVWTNVARMRTLNMNQARAGNEMHLCPLQFDICNRVITQFSMKDETVFDPFGGIMSVPYCAVKLGRRGIGVELSPSYYADGVEYLKASEDEVTIPTLFDLVEAEEELAAASGD